MFQKPGVLKTSSTTSIPMFSHPWANTEDVSIVAKDLWASSKALVLTPYIKLDWLVPLRSAIDRLIPEGLIVASNRGKLLTDVVIFNPC